MVKKHKSRSVLLKELQLEPRNIYRAGSAKYYRDALFNIYGICFDYDGHNSNNPKQMRGLVDEVRDMALKAFQNKALYVKPKSQVP